MDYNIVVNNGNTLPQDIITLFGEEDVITYVEDKTTMTDLVVKLGLFKSKGQARKAGRVGDIPEGWTVVKGNRKTFLFIWNPSE